MYSSRREFRGRHSEFRINLRINRLVSRLAPSVDMIAAIPRLTCLLQSLKETLPTANTQAKRRAEGGLRCTCCCGARRFHTLEGVHSLLVILFWQKRRTRSAWYAWQLCGTCVMGAFALAHPTSHPVNPLPTKRGIHTTTPPISF